MVILCSHLWSRLIHTLEGKWKEHAHVYLLKGIGWPLPQHTFLLLNSDDFTLLLCHVSSLRSAVRNIHGWRLSTNILLLNSLLDRGLCFLLWRKQAYFISIANLIPLLCTDHLSACRTTASQERLRDVEREVWQHPRPQGYVWCWAICHCWKARINGSWSAVYFVS